MANALESWAMAIKYCNEIMAGKATLVNRKYFVSSLQNAIELFIKQYMLNICDYRVAEIKDVEADGEPLKSYVQSTDLNDFFIKLHKNDKKNMKKFRTAEFNKLIDWQKNMFKEYYSQNANAGNVIGDGLKTLQTLRNNETHFYIDSVDFLTDDEFKQLYNMMIVFFEILVHYHLLLIWGDTFGEVSNISFKRAPLKSFSYKAQLRNAEFVKTLKTAIEKEVFPTGSGEDAYAIAEDIVSICEIYSQNDFNEIWEYVEMLLKYDILEIQDYSNSDNIDGVEVCEPYREYRLKI